MTAVNITKSKFKIALSNLNIEEQIIRYLKGGRVASFACVPFLEAEYCNIILDKSGYSLNRVDITIVRNLMRYHTYRVKVKQHRGVDYKNFAKYNFIHFFHMGTSMVVNLMQGMQQEGTVTRPADQW